jgi:endonuclease/exonuclease/phosphatase family metal-dependent hydrolase
MPFYYRLHGRNEADRRTAEGLLRLKDGLDQAGVPPRGVEENLLLATWNIREFDSAKYGIRRQEPLLYIAEIINRFDLVAVQEVRDDLTALNRLLGYLGGWWNYVMTDVTEGTRGNRERMVFLYDSRKIAFGGLAGEVVLPPMRREGHVYEPATQLARTPFVVGFRSGWFKFTICTTHILYGTAVAEDPDRVKEIELLAQFLADRADEKYAWARNMILLGDFNIFMPEDKTLQGITKAGFVVPKAIQDLPSNVPQNKHYDQIAFVTPDIVDQLQQPRAGVFNYYDQVYRPEDEAAHAEDMGSGYSSKDDAKKKKSYYMTWRTYQMSDHLPMWIELKTDFSRPYLQRKVTEGATGPVTAPNPVLENIL